MDIKNNKGLVKRRAVTVRCGDDLYDKSKGRDVYEDFILSLQTIPNMLNLP